jgi:hypothetical protein
MSPNYVSSVILDNLVFALNETQSTIDFSLSNKEYALAYNSTERNIQLLFGLTSIKSNNQSFIQDIIVFGKGLDSNINSNSYVLLPSSGSQIGFNITEILSEVDLASNCYILGAAYLTTSETEESIQFSLGKSKDDPNGSVFIISKDIDLDTMKNIMLFDDYIIFPEPTANSEDSVLLYKFIIDVDTYDSTIQNSRILMYVSDYRKTRGLFGFTDENLSLIVTSNIILNDKNINSLYNLQKSLIKDIVTKWINLPWSPGFIEYWQTSAKAMPSYLRNFIYNEIGIVI